MDASPISYPSHGHQACLQVEDHSYWFRHRNECISALVHRFLQSGCFADVGGGNGFVAKRLQDEGLDVTLIEPGSDGARNARELRGIHHVECTTLDQSQGQFDAIGAFDVVEHIGDDASFVDEVARHLREDGLFFSTVPVHPWLWSSADDEAGHFRRYTAETYASLLSKRFDIEFASYFFAPLVLPIALFRSVPYRLGHRTVADEVTSAKEHGTDDGVLSKIIANLLRTEVARIEALSSMKFGSSLIVAARKKH